MKKIGLAAAIFGLGVIFVLGMGTNVLADWGRNMGGGGGHHMGYSCGGNYGPGPMMGGYGYGRGGGKQLTDEQIEKIDAERKAFYEATKESREQLFDKQRELARELGKESPDGKIAASIQKEISTIRADLDLKRIDHMLALRKIDPDAGYGPGFGQGPGRGRRGPGPGQARSGYGMPCWN